MKTKSLQSWLEEYGVSHQNRQNVIIHKVCVPAIFWSLLGFFFGLPFEAAPFVAYAIIIGGLVFYARLGMKPLALMLIVVSACLVSYRFLIQAEAPLWPLSLGVFIVAWIGQFIGHRIEGRKPSFFQDLQFLLVGPLWVFLGNSRYSRASDGERRNHSAS